MKIKQEDGSEIEVFTQEELNAKAEEAAEAARKETEAEKSELEDKLKKLQDKEFNFNQLRSKTEKGNEAAEKLASEIEVLKQQIGEVKQQPFVKAKEEFVTKNVGADEELKKKFEFFFEPLASKAKTQEDYNAALAGAFAAATGGTRQPSFEGLMVSTRVTPPSSGGNEQESEASKTFANAFGITSEDKKKYGKK